MGMTQYQKKQGPVFYWNQIIKTFRCTSLCVYVGISYHLHPCRHRMHLRGHQNRCLSGLGYPLGYSCHMHHHDCPYHCSADLYLASTSSYPKIHTYTQEQSILNNQR